MIVQRCGKVDVPLAKERKQAWRKYTAAHADNTQPRGFGGGGVARVKRLTFLV